MKQVRNSTWLLFFGLIVVFLQGTVFRAFLPDYLVPNLMLSMVVYLAFFDNTPYAAVLVFLLGLEVDFYSGQQTGIGPSSGALVVVFGILASMSQRVYIESPFAIFVIALFSSALNYFVQIVLTYGLSAEGMRIFSWSLLGALITGCVTPLVFRLLDAFFRRRGAISTHLRSRSARV